MADAELALAEQPAMVTLADLEAYRSPYDEDAAKNDAWFESVRGDFERRWGEREPMLEVIRRCAVLFRAAFGDTNSDTWGWADNSESAQRACSGRHTAILLLDSTSPIEVCLNDVPKRLYIIGPSGYERRKGDSPDERDHRRASTSVIRLHSFMNRPRRGGTLDVLTLVNVGATPTDGALVVSQIGSMRACQGAIINSHVSFMDTRLGRPVGGFSDPATDLFTIRGHSSVELRNWPPDQRCANAKIRLYGRADPMAPENDDIAVISADETTGLTIEAMPPVEMVVSEGEVQVKGWLDKSILAVASDAAAVVTARTREWVSQPVRIDPKSYALSRGHHPWLYDDAAGSGDPTRRSPLKCAGTGTASAGRVVVGECGDLGEIVIDFQRPINEPRLLARAAGQRHWFRWRLGRRVPSVRDLMLEAVAGAPHITASGHCELGEFASDTRVEGSGHRGLRLGRVSDRFGGQISGRYSPTSSQSRLSLAMGGNARPSSTSRVFEHVRSAIVAAGVWAATRWWSPTAGAASAPIIIAVLAVAAESDIRAMAREFIRGLRRRSVR